MKKLFSILAIGTSLYLVSCKKENLGAPEPVLTPGKKLATTTLNEDRSFVYNANGTIKEIRIDNLGYEYKEVYTYSTNKVNYTLLEKGKKSAEGEYLLANGKVITFTETDYNDNGDINGTYINKYSYNEKGLMNKKEYGDGYYVLFTYDANNNLTKLVEYDSQGQAGEMEEFTYGNQKDLFPQYSYLNSYNTGFFLVPLSKYLPVSKKSTNLSNGEVTGSGTISYDLDADGYVLKGKYTRLTGNASSYEWNNTFQ